MGIRMEMKKIVEQGLLYDFYGELLTDHQKRIYQDAVYNDLSLGEIADEYGITRQGVHDLLKRCSHSLQEYENKLHLIEKFLKIREKVNEINEMAEDAAQSREILAERIKCLSDEILEEL